jgi:hypothetical protein
LQRILRQAFAVSIKKTISFFLIFLTVTSCGNKEECGKDCCKKDEAGIPITLPGQSVQSSSGELKCKLSSEELMERKRTVLAELKNSVLEQKELYNGYSFKFKGDKETVKKLNSFIESEKSCCDFFNFDLKVSDDKSAAWLRITGSGEAKKFMADELGLVAKSKTSTITCPKCGFKKSESLPTEVCQLVYVCTKCGNEMHPQNGDCCVFCTYGDQKCPSRQ